MRTVYCDIETNGLDPSIIWCIVCKHSLTGTLTVFKNPEEVQRNFKRWLDEEPTQLIGHNFVTYDMPVINKLVPGVNLKVSQIIDTLVMSRLFNCLRTPVKISKGTMSQHSLEAWAIRMGKGEKVQNDVWTEYHPTILERCLSDVEITEDVYKELMKEGSEVSQESIRLEHTIAYICEKQKRDGFAINLDMLYKLQNTLIVKEKELNELVLKSFPPIPILSKEVIPKVKKDGTVSTVGLRGIDPKIVHGPFCHVEWQPFNLSSPLQVVERMNKLGWKPYIFTDNGQPKVNDENMATLPENAPVAGKIFLEYRMVTGRLNKVKEIINGLGEDGRIHGEILHIGASTHRMAHNNPNMANIPAVDAEYGEVMRDMFTVSDPIKYRLIGCDAKGIQLRMLAHYINDPEYTKEVVDGDVHTKNQQLAGFPTRSMAKTFIYAFCFGAGAARVGSIVGAGSTEGKVLIDRFLTALPGLKKVKQDAYTYGRAGKVKGLDGRILPVNGAHFYLPALLQGGEQSVMKLALSLWYTEAMRRGYDFKLVANVHDEWQTEVHVDHMESLGKLQEWSIREAGRRLNLNCPMDGEAKYGLTWKDTH